MSASEPSAPSSEPDWGEETIALRRAFAATSRAATEGRHEMFVGDGNTAPGVGVVIVGTTAHGTEQRTALSELVDRLRARGPEDPRQPVGLLVLSDTIDPSSLEAALPTMQGQGGDDVALVIPITTSQAASLAESATMLWQFVDEAIALVGIAADRPADDRANATTELIELLATLVERIRAADGDEATRHTGASLVHRVLAPKPITSLDMYLTARGGAGLEIARLVEPEALIDELETSGLRGRGGAGFPTHRKWRTVAENRTEFERPTVVVNGAEGEPGTYKDRTILLNNPYQVIEGALIAAIAVGADQIIFGLKHSFTPQVARLRAAIDEVEAAGWAPDVELSIFEGPNEYLYGEETALLECIDGRYPLPRVAPPFRRGAREVVEGAADLDTGSGLPAHVEMAGPDNETGAPPTLVDNVETIANVPRIISRGGAWFRTEGTDASPGTIVCTITGSTNHAAVGEVILGTTLRQAIDLIGGGPRPGRTIKAAMSGVANGLVPSELLDTPLTYEHMAAIGSGLGAAGFVVFDDTDDLVAAIGGVSRFLAVESCGQCTPCKQDGLRIAELLGDLRTNHAGDSEIAAIEDRLRTIANGARCYLATQHEVVVRSLLQRFGDEVTGHLTGAIGPAAEAFTAELAVIEDGVASQDEHHRDKQPDWTYGDTSSGQTPAERLGEHRAPEILPE